MANINNNSTNAVNKNMIIPDVYAELVREKIEGKVVISQCAKVIKSLVLLELNIIKSCNLSLFIP